MESLVLTGRLLLFLVFTVAGFAKLADRAGSRQALIEFGVPSWFAGLGGVVLPVAELAVALALLPIVSAWTAAVGALALLLIFIAGIAVNLARGRRPDCHCFGQLHSAPAGWSTLGRNIALAAVAGFVVEQGPGRIGPSLFAWMGQLGVFERVALGGGVICLGLIAAEVAFMLQILLQQGRLLLRLDAIEARLSGATAAPALSSPATREAGLPLGTRAPRFQLDGLRGGTSTLEGLLTAGKPMLLLFTHPRCGPCQSVMSDIGRRQEEYSSKLTIALVSEGTQRDNRVLAKSAGLSFAHVLLQKKREVAEAYRCYGTPGAVLVQPDGNIGSALAMGLEPIRALMAQATGQTGQGSSRPGTPRNDPNGDNRTMASVVKRGEQLPPLNVQDLDGNTVELTSFLDRTSLLLFWNPDCGFCQQMLNDLKEWEASPPLDAPKLLVISTGTVEANLAMNLSSLVVLDHNIRAAPVFGAMGTPMAVLVDAQGKVTSDVAAGAEAVFALARGSANSQPKEQLTTAVGHLKR